MKNIIRLLLLLPCAAASPAAAQEQDRLLEIPPGITKMDITGDGEPETIVKTERQNFNAYDYFVTLFIWHGSYGPEEETENGSGYDIVGIRTAGHALEHEIVSNEPEECANYGYRFLFKNKKAFLITAQINTTTQQGRCEASNTTFTFYSLKNNRESAPASTEYYFEDFKTWTTEKKYGDVMTAFTNNERHLIDIAN